MGSPCHRPHIWRIESVHSQFHNKRKLVLDKHQIRISITSSENSTSTKVSLKKDHSMRSYAFSRSMLTTIPPFLPFFVFSLCYISWHTTRLSVIYRQGTNLLWLGEMTSLIISFNQFARTLVTSLKETLHRLIGRNCLIFSGLSVLGIKTTKASIVSLPISPPPRIQIVDELTF